MGNLVRITESHERVVPAILFSADRLVLVVVVNQAPGDSVIVTGMRIGRTVHGGGEGGAGSRCDRERWIEG